MEPCPFCGFNDKHEICTNEHEDSGPYYTWVQCYQCEARGPEVEMQFNEDPVAAWDKRYEKAETKHEAWLRVGDAIRSTQAKAKDSA